MTATNSYNHTTPTLQWYLFFENEHNYNTSTKYVNVTNAISQIAEKCCHIKICYQMLQPQPCNVRYITVRTYF